MPLDPMLREVARMVLALPSAAGFALAGGGAMLEHGFVERPTVDLDLFAVDVGLLARFTSEVAAALQVLGHDTQVVRESPTFVRL